LQRVPKLQQQDQAIWWDTMVKMQKLLRKSSLSLFNSGKIDKETMHNYFMSGKHRLLSILHSHGDGKDSCITMTLHFFHLY
jgi:hypothetical protein